jgi:flagellar M-ring protein FliF
MDFLNQAYSQLNDLFRSMTPAARITAGLLLLVVVISLVYLVRFQTSGADEYLLGGRPFSDRELATMEAAFSKASLDKWEIRERRIGVPRGQKSVYLAALVEGNALPAGFGSYFSKLSEDEGPFVNRQQREMRFKTAKEQELALIFKSMKGIEDAAVQFDEVDKGGFPRRKERTALVSVRPEGNNNLDVESVKSIRKAMAAAIAGLTTGNVTVVDLNGPIAHTEAGIDGSPGGADDIYVQCQATWERLYQDKIYEKLATTPGVIVGVNVALDPKLQHETTELVFGPQPHSVDSASRIKETTSSRPANGGRVGAVPNGVGNTGAAVQSASLSMSETTSTETDEQQRNILDQTTTMTRTAPFAPNYVTASVSVPSSYYEKIWRQKNPTPEGEAPKTPDPTDLVRIEEEVKARIEEEVVQLLPKLSAGEDPYPLVQVTTYQDFAPPPATEASIANKAFTWLGGNWQTLAMTLVGLFSLLIVRGMIRSVQPAPPPESVAAAAQAAASGEGTEEPSASMAEGVLRRRLHSTGPSLREELTDMVREDVDAAANVLRNWIGDAA